MTDGVYKPYLMADVRRAAAARRFTVVSMFAGAAGSSTGYALAGGDVRLANEFLPAAARIYRANFPDTMLDPRDIREIIATPAAAEAFLARAGLKVGELDILDGSPPCAEFSPLGRGLRERGTAARVFDFCRLAKMVQPKIVVAENVPELATDHPILLENALDLLRFSGGSRDRHYYVIVKVLWADDFGVPQKRPRLFIIAIRKDVANEIRIADDAAVLRLFPEPTTTDPVSIRSALTGLLQSEGDVYPWRRAAMTKNMGRIIRQLPPNPEKLLRPRHVGLSAKTWYTVGRCAWDLPVPTLTAQGQRLGGRAGLVHPIEDRKFTLPELKRLTGLPDDYRFPGRLDTASERVGQMVPSWVIMAIADHLFERVLRPYAERRR